MIVVSSLIVFWKQVNTDRCDFLDIYAVGTTDIESLYMYKNVCTGIPRYTRSHFMRFRYNAIWGKKAVRKLYSNFAVTVYGGA